MNTKKNVSLNMSVVKLSTDNQVYLIFCTCGNVGLVVVRKQLTLERKASRRSNLKITNKWQWASNLPVFLPHWRPPSLLTPPDGWTLFLYISTSWLAHPSLNFCFSISQVKKNMFVLSSFLTYI